MSIKLMNAAWALDLPCGKKFVLIALCDQSNDEGYCWPSVETISRRCGLSERSVQGHLSTLEDDGYIQKSYRTGRSTVYQIDPRRICTPAESAPRTISEPSIEPSMKHKARSTKRACQLPPDFEPDETAHSLAAELEVSIETQLPKFRDYHAARGKPMKDWQAAFRNWLRNANEWKKPDKESKDRHWMDDIFAGCDNAPKEGVIDVDARVLD